VAITDLSTIDIMATRADGTNLLIAVVVNWEPESLRLVQLATKLSIMRSWGADNSPYQIEVVCYGVEPPVSAVGLVHRVGGSIVREDKTPTEGRPGRYEVDENGDLDWPAIHAANAALFAERHGLPGTVDSLADVDELLLTSYMDAVENAGEDGDVREDGDLAMLAGAYASEVMLRAYGGSWHQPDADSHLPNLRVRIGPDGHLDVGMVAKVRKYLRNGPEDAIHPLATVVAARL
jgi:hypothetical protein